MAIEIDSIQNAKSIGWADARMSRLAAGSISLNSRLTLSGTSLTGSAADSLVSLAATWNTSGTPTAFDLNITDTASNAASLLMNLRVGGTSRFSVSKTGVLTCGAAVGGVNISNGTQRVIGLSANNGGNLGGIGIASSHAVGWSSTLDGGNFGVADLFLFRDAANTLAQRNGTNAQAFNIYNTFTDASNYERGCMRWASNILEFGTEAAGTGTRRAIRIPSGNFGGFVLFPTSGVGGGGGLQFTASDGTVRTTLDPFSTGAQFVLTAVGSPVPFVLVNYNELRCNTAFISVSEITAPSAPATNSVRIYAEDNGSGKTRLMALFATGAAQQIAIEP